MNASKDRYVPTITNRLVAVGIAEHGPVPEETMTQALG